MSVNHLQASYRGTLMGVAVGDALGAPLEGAPAVTGAQIDSVLDSDTFSRFTDDTHMTIAMAESLVERQGFDGPHLARTFAEHFFSEPWRGYGSGPPRIFQAIASGAAWDEPARQLFGGTGSYGNGAAMRVAPAALLAEPDIPAVVQLAHQTAAITHTHELGLAGASLQAVVIALLVRRSPDDELDVAGLLDEILDYIDEPAYRRRLDEIRRLPPDADPSQVAATLGNGIAALDSVPTALYAFLQSPDSFEGVVRFALAIGGDVDTITSMAAALSGAYLGEPAIPRRWIDRVEGTSELRDLADRLFAISPDSPAHPES